jgi:hypothetical protein
VETVINRTRMFENLINRAAVTGQTQKKLEKGVEMPTSI